jgi:hypothetical protein
MAAMRAQRHGQYLGVPNQSCRVRLGAAVATNWQLKATFKDLARFHRQMAMYLEQAEQSDPKNGL